VNSSKGVVDQKVYGWACINRLSEALMLRIIVAGALILVSWYFIPSVLLWPALYVVATLLVIQEVIESRSSTLLEACDNWYASLYSKITSRRPGKSFASDQPDSA
jgi:hypothetical protein